MRTYCIARGRKKVQSVCRTYIEKVKVLIAQSHLTLCDPMDYSSQVPLSMGFSRQEYWSG